MSIISQQKTKNMMTKNNNYKRRCGLNLRGEKGKTENVTYPLLT